MSDGLEGIHRAIGRLEGRLTSIEDASREERSRAKHDDERITAKLELIEDKLIEYIGKQDSMQTQVYSNKHGIEGVNKDLGALKTVYSKGLGAIAVLSFFGTLVLAGVWWALTHWSELGAAVRELGKP